MGEKRQKVKTGRKKLYRPNDAISQSNRRRCDVAHCRHHEVLPATPDQRLLFLSYCDGVEAKPRQIAEGIAVVIGRIPDERRLKTVAKS